MFHLLYISILILLFFFFFNDTATTEIYTLSLHDALPISLCRELPAQGGQEILGCGAAGIAACASPPDLTPRWSTPPARPGCAGSRQSADAHGESAWRCGSPIDPRCCWRP